jgi:AhpD family alkylhydroperoxidase
MQPRLKNPILVIPDLYKALMALNGAVQKTGFSHQTQELVNMRVSQINGCGACLEFHARELAKLGETNERLLTLAGWRETTYFTPAERAALAFAEAATRLADRGEAVSDEVWAEAARHYSETELAALVVQVGMINLWNRLNVATGQLAGKLSEADVKAVQAAAMNAS